MSTCSDAESIERLFRADSGRTLAALARMLPEIPPPSLPFMAAYGIQVRSLEVVESTLKQHGLAARRDGEHLVAAFPPELGHGAWLFSAVHAGGADPR